jgi:hypothetical protein
MPMAKDHVDEDIEELKQVQLDSLRRLADRLQNELDEVRKDRDAWRSWPPSRQGGWRPLISRWAGSAWSGLLWLAYNPLASGIFPNVRNRKLVALLAL